MSQGPRGGWTRKLVAGLGAILCVSVIGCTDIDKPKTGTNAKQPGPGLPGTARLPGQPGTGAAGSGQQPGMNSGMQPLGSAGTPMGRSPTNGYPTSGSTTFGAGASGNTYVPSVGPYNNYAPIGTGPVSPAAGLGAGAAAGSGGGYSMQPSLADPGLLPPASPDSRGAPVAPPGSGPMAPTKPPY